jgi:hypothetical protein
MNAVIKSDDWGYSYSRPMSRETSQAEVCQLFALAFEQPRVSVRGYLQRREVLYEIAALGELEDGWDGAGAPAPSASAIAGAQNLIAYLAKADPLPEFAPNPTGTLSLYWRLPEGQAEIEFGKTRYSWIYFDRSGAPPLTNSGNIGDESNGDLAVFLSLICGDARELAQRTHPIGGVEMSLNWDAA